jgi:hypothetical protein
MLPPRADLQQVKELSPGCFNFSDFVPPELFIPHAFYTRQNSCKLA